MGAKQTKIDEIYPDVPDESHVHQQKGDVRGRNILEVEIKPSEKRKRFLKGLTYNLNDPRSPSVLNRTPLVFDDKSDKTLNLDDTFADLFVASSTPAVMNVPSVLVPNEEIMEIVDEQNAVNTDSLSDFNAFEKSLSLSDAENVCNSVEFASLIEEETMPCTAVLKQTPQMLQQTLDPRSPTIGLPRTPIVFDDDEAQEDAMLEDILATLSLDFSVENSSKSFGTAAISPLSVDIKKPINKHLDRVRAIKKPEKPIRKNKHVAQKQRIYMDCENVNVTPKKKGTRVGDSEKRTPLSCVKNRVNLRSRSVELNGKSPKLRLSLTSYDDSLNPVQDPKIINLHALQGDPFDL